MEDLEDNDFVASEHDRLINAISKMDKTQHITEPTRNEPTNLNSEFSLIKRNNRIDLSKVTKVLEDTAHHVQIGKKLKKSHDGSKVLPKPLEKPVVERIKRATGYEEAKKKVGRWDPVVARSRTVDVQSFPLKQFSSKLQPTGEFLSKFKFKSPLEKELDELDPPVEKKVEDEEEQLYPMSYEEMVEHRQHLAKIRAQESYKAAKAKRQSKIKSKKYHRILKKEKLKLQLKEFEELQKKDPEEALKKLETLEKARALERHTLRHKNTGKWAKSKLVRAKYDKDVRQQLAEQLAVSRGLTHKTQDTESTDDEADNNEVIPDLHLSQDPLNPWMLKQDNKSNVDTEFDFGYKKYIEGRMFKRKEVESDSEDSDEKEHDNAKGEIEVLKDSIMKMNQETSFSLSDDDSDIKTESAKPAEAEKSEERPVVQKTITMAESKSHKNKSKKSIHATATSEWTVEVIGPNKVDTESSGKHEDIIDAFDSLEDDISGQVEKKLKAIRKTVEHLEKKKAKESKKSRNRNKESKDFDNLEYLKFKNQRVKAIIDEELIETGSKTVEDVKKDDKSSSEFFTSTLSMVDNTAVNKTTDSNIDPSKFIEVKPKYLNSALPNDANELDELDDDEQVVPKVNIEDVFEEDDVVASFRQEKEDEINKDKPQDIDLSLPGWGSWGGKGVKAPKRKRNRFILKAPPKMPRRDENKGDIIIKEYKDPKLSAHKVTQLPFPFQSVNDYEASIRAPLGNTFIPEKAHKKLIKPSVVTKAGTIIEPMDEDELLQPKNRTFRNESVIKLLGQK